MDRLFKVMKNAVEDTYITTYMYTYIHTHTYSMYQLYMDRLFKVMKKAFEEVPANPNLLMRERIDAVAQVLCRNVYRHVGKACCPSINW